MKKDQFFCFELIPVIKVIINYLSFFVFFLILFSSTSIVNMGLPSHSILKSSLLADKKDKRWYIPMYGKHLIYFLHWLHQQDNTDYSIQCVSLTLGPSIYIEIYILCQSYNSTHKCNWNPIYSWKQIHLKHFSWTGWS